MKRYKVIKKPDFGNEMVEGVYGEPVPMSAFAPDVGSTITGEVSNVFIYGANRRGLFMPITKNKSGFIPESCLKEYIPNTTLAPNTREGNTETQIFGLLLSVVSLQQLF